MQTQYRAMVWGHGVGMQYRDVGQGHGMGM